jgi:hypothetical protein
VNDFVDPSGSLQLMEKPNGRHDHVALQDNVLPSEPVHANDPAP